MFYRVAGLPNYGILMTYTYRIILAVCFLSIFPFSYAFQNDTSRENIFSLSNYDVIKTIKVEGIEDDLSGITYSPVSDSLFAVINEPPMLVELDKSGNVIRNIELIGFDDTEGVTYRYDNVFAITQERYRKVSLVTITSQTQELNASQYKSLSLVMERGDNWGLEGVAWSPLKGMFLANEKSPSRITRLPLPLFTGMQQAGKDYSDILPQQIDKLPLKDIAGLHVVDQQSRLLVLSDESVSYTHLTLPTIQL